MLYQKCLHLHWLTKGQTQKQQLLTLPPREWFTWRGGGGVIVRNNYSGSDMSRELVK